MTGTKPTETDEDAAIRLLRDMIRRAQRDRLWGEFGVYVKTRNGKIADVCERTDYAHRRQ